MPRETGKGRVRDGRKPSGSRLSIDRQAAVLAEAHCSTDRDAVCKKHGICAKTLYNYESRLESDASLAELYIRKKKLLESAWADEAVRSLRTAFSVARDILEALRPAQGEKPREGALREVTGFIKITAEADVLRKVLGAEEPEGDGEQPVPDPED